MMTRRLSQAPPPPPLYCIYIYCAVSTIYYLLYCIYCLLNIDRGLSRVWVASAQCTWVLVCVYTVCTVRYSIQHTLDIQHTVHRGDSCIPSLGWAAPPPHTGTASYGLPRLSFNLDGTVWLPRSIKLDFIALNSSKTV